jgi:predicted dehydrogenase
MSKSTRRQFILRSATQAASLGLVLNGKLINLPPSLLPKPAGPNDRVNLGFIGFGIRGNILLEAAKETQQTNLVEVCDCYQGHLGRAKERTENKIATNFAQYKKLLDRKDIDAVVVATPDHWHKRIVLDALSAGKDVYIEKPMTYRIEDGSAFIDAAREHKRIVQVGSQWVSSEQHKKAREIVMSGRLGKVTKVTASYNRNSSTGSWNYPIPADLQEGVNFNWQEWLGPAPRVAFNPERVFRYRKYWDYSGGISTDLFVHLITSIHFIMDADMPKSVAATGGILHRHDGREVPDTLDALFDYGSFCVNMAGNSSGRKGHSPFSSVRAWSSSLRTNAKTTNTQSTVGQKRCRKHFSIKTTTERNHKEQAPNRRQRIWSLQTSRTRLFCILQISSMQFAPDSRAMRPLRSGTMPLLRGTW